MKAGEGEEERGGRDDRWEADGGLGNKANLQSPGNTSQPQVVCGGESAASQLAPQGAGGAPLTAASRSWQLRCCTMCKEPVPRSTHAKLVSAAGTHKCGTWIFLPCKAWRSQLHGEGILAGLGSQHAHARVSNPSQSHTAPVYHMALWVCFVAHTSEEADVLYEPE